MKTKAAEKGPTSKNIARIVLATALILLIPLAAMQFNNEVDWSLFDFLIIGMLLLGTGLAYEFLKNKMPTAAHRVVLALILLAILLLMWAELAVGVVGSPFAGD